MISSPVITAEIPLLPQWQQGVFDLFSGASSWFQCDLHDDGIQLTLLSNGRVIELRRRMNGKASLSIAAEDGPFGVIAAMALGLHFDIPLFNRQLEWISIKPFDPANAWFEGVPKDQIQLCAEALSLCPKRLVPKTCRPSLLLT